VPQLAIVDSLETTIAAALDTHRPFSFGWRAVVDVAAGHERHFVRRVLDDEIARGRVESDGNGRVRLVSGALDPSIVSALEAFGN
jgi:hypothetical protein